MKYKGFKNKKRSIIHGEPMEVDMPVQTTIRQVENGFVVSCGYHEDYIAKDIDEAVKYAKDILKGDKNEQEED